MNSNDPVLINLDIGSQLTSISCGHVLVELIKFIAYQRLQIPYTYQCLKQVVNKKREREDENIKDSLQSERHFRAASTALEKLDFILKSLQQEINCPSLPDEVCIVLGATPVTCKEVYRVLLPVACHKLQCHSAQIANDQKIHRSVFRTLVTSEKLGQMLFSQIPPTNLYVFMKKKMVNQMDSILNSDSFVYTSGCRLPRNAKIVIIDLRAKVFDNLTCCNVFNVFRDVVNNDMHNLKLQNVDDDKYHEIESNDDVRWYQSSYVMKGFKDCIVNGSSITNSWLNV